MVWCLLLSTGVCLALPAAAVLKVGLDGGLSGRSGSGAGARAERVWVHTKKKAGDKIENVATWAGPLGVFEMHRYWESNPPSQRLPRGRYFSFRDLDSRERMVAPIGGAKPARSAKEVGLVPDRLAETVIRRLDRCGASTVTEDEAYEIAKMYELSPANIGPIIRSNVRDNVSAEFWVAGFPFKCFQHTRIGIGLARVSIDEKQPSYLKGPSVPVFGNTVYVFRFFLVPFMGNVIVGAIAIGGVGLLFGKLRRQLRHRAGKCGACAYPKPDGAAKCPECGADLSRAGREGDVGR